MKLVTLLLFTSSISFANAQTTRDFMPVLDSSGTRLEETVQITTGDSIIRTVYAYFIKEQKGKRYLVTQTFDAEGRLSTQLEEIITRKGLRFARGTVYEWDSLKTRTYNVRGRHRITYPFRSLEDCKGWKTHWKTGYARTGRVVVRSVIECLGVDTVETSDGPVLNLRFRRSATRISKRRFRRKKTRYTYTMEYTWKVGLSNFECMGDKPFHGTIESRAWK